MQMHLPPDSSEPLKDAETLVEDYVHWRKRSVFRNMIAGVFFSGVVLVGGADAWGMINRTVRFPIRTLAAGILFTYFQVRARMYESRLLNENDAAEQRNPRHYQRVLTQYIERMQQRLDNDPDVTVAPEMDAITELVDRYRDETPENP